MPLVRIDMLKGKDEVFKKTLLQKVHEGLLYTLGIEDWDRFQRICEYDKESFEIPEFKTDDFMIIELTIFPGRSAEVKARAIERITSLISSSLNIRPEDIFIVINEPPLENWGMGGKQKGVSSEDGPALNAASDASASNDLSLLDGFHHISMKCDDKEKFDETVRFYTDLLGLRICKKWPEGIMLDAGNMKLEIFSNSKGITETGAIRHMAFACADVDAMAEKVIRAGYQVVVGPKDITFDSVPVTYARMAFCIGPLGEQIEFFCEKQV